MNKIRIYLTAKLNTQKNIHSNLFLLQKKHTRTNLNLLNATAYQRLSERSHIITPEPISNYNCK